MSHIIRPANPRGKATGGSLDVRPPDTPPPPTVTLVVARDGPVHRFAQLEAAVQARDFRGASTIRRELYRKLGWSIVPPRGGSDR